MSKLTSTLSVDGAEIEKGSALAVETYLRLLRAADKALAEARQVLPLVPDDAEFAWIKRHDALATKVKRHIGPVARFAEDYTKRGLEAALGDARWRKEFP